MLSWCDEHRRVPIVDEAPSGFTVAAAPEEATGDRVLVDIPWDGPECGPLLARTVQAALDAGASELAIRVPDHIPEGDMALAPGPWKAVVAADPASWTARLLAARVPAPHSF